MAEKWGSVWLVAVGVLALLWYFEGHLWAGRGMALLLMWGLGVLAVRVARALDAWVRRRP